MFTLTQIHRRTILFVSLAVVAVAASFVLSSTPFLASLHRTAPVQQVQNALFSQPPKNGALYVTAFLSESDPRALVSLSSRAKQMDAAFLNRYVLPRASCTLHTEANDATLALLAKNHVATFLTVSNGDTSWHATAAHAILTNSALGDCVINTLAKNAKDAQASGINVDLESLGTEDNAHYLSFLTTLSRRLHAQGQTMIVDVPAEPDPAFDLTALSRVADGIMVMAYDQHETTSEPGPIASKEWVQEIATRFLATVPSQKLLFGIGAYGYDWNENPDASSWDITATQAQRLAMDYGILPSFDTLSENTTFTYTDPDGQSHSVWYFSTAASAKAFEFLRQCHIAGFALWKLGMEDTHFWEAVGKMTGA